MWFSSCRFPYVVNFILSLIILFTTSLPAFADYSTNHSPDCSGAYADPANLWSPNHKFEPINVVGVTDPDGDSLSIEIQCIFQDEPVNDLGDGNTQWDADGIGESSASVLSERSGNLNGRVYHIDYIATDIHGAQCGGEILVAVDHSPPTDAIDEGRLYSSVPSENVCGQHSINNPPYIVSFPILAATSCNVYQYAAVSNDPDRDALTYSLTSAPDGVNIDSVTGLLQWDEPVAGTYEITIEVSDNRGGSDSQSFIIEVVEPLLEITSTPITSIIEDDYYTYDVAIQTDLETTPEFQLLISPAEMDITPADEIIVWQPDKSYSQGIVGSDPYCVVALDSHEGDVAFADVVAIVDESGSMRGEHRWVGEFISKLEQGLTEQNVGEQDKNRYGLVGFERYPREIPVGGSKMGLASEFITAANQLRLYGGTEDGWRSLKHVVDSYPLREEGARNLILITDEDRDSTTSITYPSILNLLVENKILLNAVVNANFYCGDGRRALGVDYTGTGYVANGSGGYTTCNNARATSGFYYTISHYVNLALETGGAAWDLNYLRSGGHWAQSFSTALIDIKVKEIVRQSLSLADVTPTNISVNQEQSSLSVDIVNRGGGAVTVPMTIHFYSGTDGDQGIFLGEVPFAGGIAGNSTVLATLQVSNLTDIQDVFVQIIITGEAEECHTDNNSAVAPIVGVAVAGECNVSDLQFFAVNVFETNLSPHLLTTELPAAEADVEYTHTIEASDPNVGDSVGFSLDTAPAGMTLNHLNGRLEWLPEKKQEGIHNVIVYIQDIGGLEDIHSYTITVNYNEPPVITSEPPVSTIARETYQYAIEATDGDGDTLTYSILTGPAGLTVNPATGLVTWIPADEQVGTHSVEVKVDDGHDGGSVQQWSITVIPANNPPEFTSEPPTAAVAYQPYFYTPTATDPDGDTLAFSIVSGSEGMVFDSSGALYWNPNLYQGGMHTVSIQVSDGQGGQDIQTFTILVNVPAPEVTFSIDNETILNGDSTVLRWTANYAETVTLDRGFGSVEMNGSRTISPDTTTSYTFTATGPGGIATQTLSIIVTYPKPSVSLSAVPAVILIGESSTLSWSATDVDTLTISPDIGVVANNGSMQVAPTETTIYTLEGISRGGTAIQYVSVVVIYPAPIASLMATPTSILIGESTTLTWNTTHADTVTITPDIGMVNASGAMVLSPTEPTTYTIEAVGLGGTTLQSVTIIARPPEPFIAIAASPSSILHDESITLTWEGGFVDTVSIAPDIGDVALSGSMVVLPKETTTYTITGTSADGTVTESVVVTVTYPVPTSVLTADITTLREGEAVTLSWNVTDADTVTIMPDIGTVEMSGSQLLTPADDTTYTVTANGRGGTATDSVHIDVYPVLVLQVTSPTDAAFTARPSVPINGLVTDGATVTVNGITTPVTGNLFSTEVVLPSMGEHIITITATDNYGQEETRIITVSYVPELTLDVTTPTDGTILSAPDVEISGQVSNNAQVTVNGVAASVNGTTFSAPLSGLTEGSHTFVVEAIDSFGQQKTVSITVYYLNLPTVTLYADKSRIENGDIVTLTWESENCESATLEPNIGEVNCSDTISLHLSESTGFIIRSTGLGKTAHAKVFVVVDDPYGDPTPEEQLHLETINQARANPPAEAARLNIDLNEGPPSTILSPEPVQPVSFNNVLARAARGHSRDMIDNHYFAHEGSDGSSPEERCIAEGYEGGTGENIAVRLSSETQNSSETSQGMHNDLFIDYNYPGRGHRINILFGSYKEVGVGIYMESIYPEYAYGGVVTCNFGIPIKDTGAILGVVYEDKNEDLIYDLDEGVANVLIEALESDSKVYTASAGGYALPLTNGEHTIRITLPDGRTLQRQVTMAGENIKLDFRVDLFTEQVSPVVNLYAVNQAISLGETTRLTWESNDVKFAELDNGIGYVPVNGSVSVSPTETTTYTITATGQGISATSYVTVYVNDFSIFPTVDLIASPATINKGESATLTWTTENTAGVHIDNGIGAVFINGSINVTPDHTTTYTLTAANQGGVISKKVKVTVLGNPVLQPAGSFGATYNNLIPVDATVDEYDPKRFSVVSGKIEGVSGLPLAGAEVTILDHPEYGTVYTDASGTYALPLQGGSTLTVLYGLDEYLPVQRQVYVPVNDIGIAKTVQLLQKDPLATQISFDGNPDTVIIHKSSVITDSSGTRSISMVFQGDNRAYVVDENGNDTQEITSFTTRATEYQTPQSMPAELPKTSAFTYCVELAVDGADRVRFAKPVVTWVNNFLGFDIGTTVPSGYYDRDKGIWIASQNGIVVELLDMDNDGIVDAVDSNGDGLADDLNKSGDVSDEALGLSDPFSYAPGSTFWRVEVTHFTPWDYNWCTFKALLQMLGYSGPWLDEAPCPECEKDKTKTGSSVGNESLVFYEDIAIPGTGLRLAYASDRTEGYENRITIPVSGSFVPDIVEAIIVEMEIAGRKYRKVLPTTPNQVHEFIWDGRDSFGNLITHKVTAHIRIGYSYNAEYSDSDFLKMSFAEFGTTLTGVSSRDKVISWKRSALTVNIADKDQGIAQGWSISAHHKLTPTDPTTLHKGDGTTVKNITSVMRTVAGSGRDGWPIDGANALDTPIGHPTSVAMDEDGNLYVSNQVYSAILKIDENGVVEVIAGGETGVNEDDNIDAKDAMLRIPNDMAFDSKGNLYIADSGAFKIRKIDKNGIITTVAGNGLEESSGDNGLAVNAGIMPTSVAVDDFANVYFAEGASCVGGTVDPVTGQCIGGNVVESSYRVRKVSTGGYITTVVGTGEKYDSSIHTDNGDGGFASAAYLSNPTSVSLDQEGNLYIADGLRIRKVNTSGTITTVAGNGYSGYTGDGGLATDAQITHASGITFDKKGNFYFSQYYGNGDVIRKVTGGGYISTVAGKGAPGLDGDNGPATHALLKQPQRLVIDAYGFIYIPDKGNGLIRKVSIDSYNEGETHFIEANVGHLISADGFHTDTYDLESGIPLLSFGYGIDKQLNSITDQFGNVITIEYSGSVPTAIVSPDGLRTELSIDVSNQLIGIIHPDNSSYTFEYLEDDGLLSAKIEPNGNRFEHYFDERGRITSTNDAENGLWEFSRSKTYNGKVTSTITTPNTMKSVEKITYSTGAEEKVVTSPDGSINSSTTSADGLDNSSQSSCGMRIETFSDLDPWFGNTYTRSATVSTPAELAFTTSVAKEYTDADHDDFPDTITTRITANNKVSTLVHDVLNSTNTITSPEGRSVTTSYNPTTLQTIQSQVPELHPTDYGYRNDGKLQSVTTGSRTTAYTYDAMGNLSTVTDPLSRLTNFTNYDEVGRVTGMVRSDNTVIQYDYDENGNMSLLITPKPADNTFTYNGVNKRSAYQTHLGFTTAYTYNEERQLTQVTLPSTRTIVNSYDKGRLITTTTDEWTNNYYYACGNLLDSVSRGGESLSYTYDGSLPKTITQSGTLNTGLALTYNNDFNLTTFSYADGTESYEYDNDDLLTRSGAFIITRNAANGLPETVSDTSYLLDRSFNGYGEADSIDLSVTGNPLLGYQFTRNNGGQITTRTETVDGAAQSTSVYDYDDLGRLLTVTRDSVLTEEYRYDDNGNRTYEMNTELGISGRSFSSSEEDHTLTAGDVTYTFDYDDYLAERTVGTETTGYVYSSTGELMSVSLPDGTAISYVNDPNGRRIAKLVNGTIVEKYLWSGLTTLLAVYDGSDNLVQRFEYADGRMPVAMTMGGGTYYLAYDQVGTLRLVTDSSGNVVKQIDYDTFGNILGDSNLGFTVPFGFSGGLHDRDTGLVRFGYRDYMPEIGKWTAKDPILYAGGDSNLYGYVSNDPVNWVDPLGLEVQVHSRSVSGTMGAGAHTAVTVTDSSGRSRTYGSYGVDGQNQVIINNETDQGPNSLSRTSSETIPPPQGMSQDQWDRTVNQAGQSRNLTQRQDYDLWGGDGGNTSGNCHTTTRGIINDAGGSIPPNYNPPGLNPGLHP